MCTNTHAQTHSYTPKERAERNLWRWRGIHPLQQQPHPTLLLSLWLCPSPFAPFFPSVISSPLKQHLLQSHSLGAPSWCSVHSCMIQCQLPVFTFSTADTQTSWDIFILHQLNDFLEHWRLSTLDQNTAFLHLSLCHAPIEVPFFFFCVSLY